MKRGSTWVRLWRRLAWTSSLSVFETAIDRAARDRLTGGGVYESAASVCDRSRRGGRDVRRPSDGGRRDACLGGAPQALRVLSARPRLGTTHRTGLGALRVGFIA